MAEPHRQIIAVADQVAQPVVEVQLDPQLRVLAREGVDGGGDEPLAIGDRAGHAQQAARGLIVGLDGGQGLVAFVDQAAAAGQEVAAGVRQLDPAGGAVEQAGLQPVLQPGDLAADRRGRQAQPFGGGREAGLFGDSGEFVDPVPTAHRDVRS
ncbi:hypothetical protein D3C86_1501790 [compost metagenome]